MIRINVFLDEVLDDFIQYVKTKKKLCDLLDVHFDAGKIPDYSNKHIQQLYLLRYAYAYAFEYKVIYKDLINRIGMHQKIKVTSVGCGNLLDYWSLVQAVKGQSDICYRGVDTIDWSYKIQPRDCDDVKWVIGDAIELFQKEHSFSSDIYIFPKSISEFSENEVFRLARCFTEETISKDIVHFLFSLRTDHGSMERDTNKTRILYKRLIDCGFRTNDNSNKYLEFKDTIKDKSICKVDDDFQHPGNVVDYLKDLYTHCADLERCFDDSDCKERLGRWPILRCKYAAWQIFSFER